MGSLAGKPFISLRPSKQAVTHAESAITGLVFRENKFPSEPVLPFASLAMPFYSLLSSSSSYLDIDNNQFPCSCQKLGWLLAFGVYGYNSHSLEEVGSEKGRGTTTFIKNVYKTAGQCIECNHKECVDTEDRLDDYSSTALDYDQGEGLRCGRKGLLVRNYDDTSDKQGRITIHDAKNSDADIDAVESGNEAIYENKASSRNVKENKVTLKSRGKTVTRTPYKNKEYLVVIGEEE